MDHIFILFELDLYSFSQFFILISLLVNVHFFVLFCNKKMFMVKPNWTKESKNSNNNNKQQFDEIKLKLLHHK